MMFLPSIEKYCQQEVEGWTRLPEEMLYAKPGDEHLSCAFINESEGIHMMASVRNIGSFPVIHVSIGQIRSFRSSLTQEELANEIYQKTPEILQLFFGNRGFSEQPDDPRRPTVKHYFSTLEQKRESFV